jgi:hypothetical protein
LSDLSLTVDELPAAMGSVAGLTLISGMLVAGLMRETLSERRSRA